MKNYSLYNLVFDGVSASVRSNNLAFIFLGLMSCLDALLGIGSASNYAIPRNCAILLSESINEGHEIMKEIQNLYSLRSAVIHHGKYDKVKSKHIINLMINLKKCVMKMIAIGITDKSGLKDMFTELGFCSLSNFQY